MKNIFKMVSLLVLVLFSFFYTDRVMNFINKKDPLMNKIDLLKDKYEILDLYMPWSRTYEIGLKIKKKGESFKWMLFFT